MEAIITGIRLGNILLPATTKIVAPSMEEGPIPTARGCPYLYIMPHQAASYLDWQNVSSGPLTLARHPSAQ